MWLIFRNSGKDYNDLGRFEDCLDITTEEFRYILATIPKAFPIPMSMGICVPATCNVQDFNNFKPYIIESINVMIPELFENIKGFDLSQQLTVNDMFFEDSNQRNS